MRVHPDGSTDVVADVRAGPTVSPSGPKARCTCATTAGRSRRRRRRTCSFPGPFDLDRYSGGLIQRIDHDGTLGDLYTKCSGRPLRSPNDLVMDGHGGFYFSDFGVSDVAAPGWPISAPSSTPAATAPSIDEVVYPVQAPNGVGLSPDGSTLYYAETYTGRVFRRRVVEPGVLEAVCVPERTTRGRCCAACPGLQMLDSLAVDAEGWVVRRNAD